MIKRRSTEECVFYQKGGKFQMSEPQETFEDQKIKIIAQTAELSRLLGMIPSDGTIDVHEFTSLWNYIQQWKSCFDK